MKLLMRALLSVALTIPVFFGLTRVDVLMSWLFSESGYQVLDPLFRLFGAVGVEGHESVIAGVVLVFSFFIALGIASMAIALLKRPKAQEPRPRS